MVAVVKAHKERDRDDGCCCDGSAEFYLAIHSVTLACGRDTELVDDEWQEEAHGRLVETVQHVCPEDGARVLKPLDPALVQLRIGERYLCINVLVECAHDDDWQGSEGEIVEENERLRWCRLHQRLKSSDRGTLWLT